MRDAMVNIPGKLGQTIKGTAIKMENVFFIQKEDAQMVGFGLESERYHRIICFGS